MSVQAMAINSTVLAAALRRHQAGQLEAAAALYRQILQAEPQQAEALHLLGLLQHQTGAGHSAIDLIRQAIAQDSHNPLYWGSLALVYRETGQLAAAAACYRRRLQLTPGDADSHFALGVLQAELDQPVEALASFRQTVDLNPAHAVAFYNLGVLLGRLQQPAEAIASYRQALAVRPGYAEAAYNLAVLLRRQNRVDEALAYYRQAAALQPDNIFWQLERDTVFPVVMPNSAAIDAWRARLAAALSRYSPGSIDLAAHLPAVTASNALPTLYLNYHGRSDRTLKEQYARLFTVSGPLAEPPAARRPEPPYRLGFVVTARHEGIFLRVMGGLLERLDLRQFTLSLICPVASIDRLTAGLSRRDITFLALTPDLAASIQRIKAQQLDLVYFWEVGSDSLNYFLPFFRLAPLQVTSWGAMGATGLPQIDMYVSSRYFEPPDAADHYSEQLVQLDSLLTWFERPPLPQPLKSRAAFGLPAEAHLYLCPQNLLKIQPEFDEILAEILRRDPAGRLLLFTGFETHWQAQLLNRWQTALPEALDRIQFLPRQSYADYLNLLALADVVLDTTQFNGGATTYEALAVGAPVVTMPTALMRGRMTAGCYRRMGVLDCIADSPAAYVDLAVRLATQPRWRATIKAKILAASEVLYQDQAVVRTWEQFFAQAVKKDRDHPLTHVETAGQRYRQMLEGNPASAEAWYRLGLDARQSDQLETALDYLQQAIALDGADAQPVYALGSICRQLDRRAEAVQYLRQAVAIDPSLAEAWYELGFLLAKDGQWAEAEQCYRSVVKLQPTNPGAWYQLGGMCWQQRQIEPALEYFERSLALDPNQPLAYGFWGQGLAALGFRDSAIEKYEKALALSPHDAALHNNIGIALMGQKRNLEAKEHFSRALALAPDRAVFHYNLGAALEQLNQYEAAGESFRAAAARNGANPLWQLKAVAVCPATAPHKAAIQQWRREFEAALDQYPAGAIDLARWLPDLHSSSVQAPFNLHYHGLNDRMLKEKYARLFSPPPPSPARQRKLSAAHRLRVGFLVTHGHEGVFLRFMAGLIQRLDLLAFEPFVITHVGSIELLKNDISSDQIQYLPIGDNLPDSIKQIQAAQFDLIYYWEIGTDALNYFLPFFRLAPVQCTSWGSPTTTGIPQVDYFISSELFEPEDAPAHYSERLVKLNTLGMWYSPPPAPAPLKPRSAFGLSDNDRVYLCVQNLNKYHFDFDAVLGEILRRDPQGQLLIKANQAELDDMLRQRLQQKFSDLMPRIRFVPNLSYPDYLNLMAIADVLLDTLHYTGGSTAHEAVAIGTPMVTWPGEFMRGRMTYGCYRKIGVLDTVVWSAEEYVAKAMQIAADRSYQQRLRQKIVAANHHLFEDLNAVRELEQVFQNAVRSKLGLPSRQV